MMNVGRYLRGEDLHVGTSRITKSKELKMNKRIKELAQQAAARDDDCCFEWDTPFSEKFAELIVRQCVKSTLSLRNTAIDNEWNLDETFHMIVDTIVEDLDMQHIFRGKE